MCRGLRVFNFTFTTFLFVVLLPKSHAFRANIAFWKKAAPAGYDCVNGSSPIGATCIGGAIYAGEFNGKKYMVTPGGCTDSATPTCAGGTDFVTKTWGSAGVNHGTTSTTDGKGNTTTLAAGWSNTYAAKFCEDMDYGGFDDWYLPAKDELNYLYQNKAALGGFASAYYWSSTQYNNPWAISNAYYQNFSDGGQHYTNKTTAYRVRCVRRY